jgi:hypothetical protein
MFDRLQAWAATRGFASNLSIQPNTGGGKIGYLRIRNRQVVRTNNHYISTSGGNPASLDKGWKDEEVWCITNANHTIITRRNGHVAIMGQCAVLSEGYDSPETSCIIMARPTQSRPLFVQQVGRGSRKAPAKVDCLILDVCDVSSRHKLSVQHLPEAAGIAYSHADPDELDQRAAPRHSHPLLVNDTTYCPAPVQTRAVDLVLKWEEVAEGRYKLTLSEGTLWVAPREGGYIVGIVFRDGRKQQLTPRPVSLDWAQAFADDKARLISARSVRLVDRAASWRSRPASQKQLSKLDRWC